jgi:hypothetical protein
MGQRADAASTTSPRPDAFGVAVWSSPSWRAKALAWIDDALAGTGLKRSGEPEQPHLRPWATVLKVPTANGPVWFKAAAPATAFEVRLYELLAALDSTAILTPIATDPDRGWMILPDGGTPLGARLEGEALLDGLEAALPRYAELQRQLAPQAGTLVAFGLADMRPAMMSQRLDEALSTVAPLLESIGTEKDRDDFAILRRREPVIRDWCRALLDLPGGASIDHNDLHPWNILAGPSGRAAEARFYDWGDSVVSHPFASLLVALGSVRDWVLKSGPEDPRIDRLRDAYLEPFGDLAPHKVLVETVETACRVGKIARVLTWHRAVQAMKGGHVEGDWRRAPIDALLALDDETYLGRV